jgi:outer membrane receptor protein involved in Fe transport
MDILGQPQMGNSNQSGSPKESKIIGKVVDKATSAPIEYASLGIFNMRDSSLVSGGITDGSGVFSVDKIPYGRFYLEIAFLGYKKIRVNSIVLNPNQKLANLGLVKLEPSTTALSEVEIVGNRNPVEYKIDKKIVSVGSNIIAAGGSAVDALENTPSVQVDIEGNVELRGSSSFTVLIDGRPSVLKGSEALQQIPASSIQSIEIITNPSAKFDPEGSAGIINVIMKKQKQAGFNGIVNASASTNGGYSGDFLFNLRAPKFNYYIGANYNNMRFKNSMVSNKETYKADTTFFEQVNSNGEFIRKGYGFKGGIDFFMDNKNTISVSGSYRDRNNDRESNTLNHNYRNDLSLENQYFKRYNYSNRKHTSYEGNIDYTRKFNDNGHQLQASVNYSQGPGTEDAFLTQYTTNEKWIVLNNDNVFNQLTTEGGKETELTTKLDYSYPVNENSKLETGYQGDYRNSSDIYHLKNSTTIPIDYVEDYNQFNDLKFSDQVQALYSTYAGSLNKLFDYQVGFRVEYSNRELQQKKINEAITFKRWDYFPSIHISKKLKDDLQFQTSYSRRIRRPRERELDPCEVIIDSRNIRVGNPNVTPEYTDSYELNLQKSFNGAGFISGELFHRHTSDLISDYEYKRNDTISVQSYRNFNHSYSTGFEGMFNMPIVKWWTLNTSVSLYDYRLKGSDTESESVDKNTFSWNARINSMFRFKWGTQLQLMGFYNAPSVTVQGHLAGFFFTNVGARQDFFKRKVTFSVQVRDLFGQSKFERTQEGSSFKSHYCMQRQSQVVTFSLSFKINNYKPEKREKDSGGEMDFDSSGGGML